MHPAIASPRLALLTTVLMVLLTHHVPGARGGLIGIIQKNVLGFPEFHKQQLWQFDPSVAARRAPEFIALHGFRSEKLIERIGLGTDGRQDERREQQMVRDFLYDQQQKQQEQQQNIATTGSGVHLLPSTSAVNIRRRRGSSSFRRATSGDASTAVRPLMSKGRERVSINGALDYYQ